MTLKTEAESGALHRNGLHRLMHLKLGPQAAALLEGMALLEWV